MSSNTDEPLLLDNHHELDDGEEKEVGFVKEFGTESKRLWELAGPAIFTSICQYSLGALTQTFAGQVGELELAAVSIENSVIAGLAFGVMLGMGSALETLCGQAFGAGQLRMLGIYMQRSWIILLTTACILVPIYVVSPAILLFAGQTTRISNAAGKFALWMIPQLFAYAMNFPIQKFLQAQRKVLVMAWISAGVLVLHVLFSCCSTSLSPNLMELGLDSRDWLSKTCMALSSSLWPLLSCYGLLPNPLVPVDAMSICMNINGWQAMISIGFNAAISVRVSNELGAGNARLAKFSVIVVSLTSTIIGAACMIVVLATREYFLYLFTNSEAVANETKKLAMLLAWTVLLNSLQPVLSGVAVGAGWQALVAYINIACYYIVGLPAGVLLGFKLDLGAMGIWGGMIGGICLQTIILIAITAMTNWEKEASLAVSRVKQWGGAAASD
ncbi:hypothetical protein K7X08_016088 [Anisodus acutangulus]|uniref:Protein DETOXIFICATION n=1 Tax=Anisodus acutangulus TaxID=402998 RepID=A0A9Q1QZQ0_9SOLA|nr:hypothetical protein K7X08_016088 [Anisodus acutangulus]